MAGPLLLSPSRYMRTGYGLALPTGYTLSMLRSALVRAQNNVTRFCNAPKQPQPFDWRGGTMTDEQHQWKIVSPLAYGPGARRVYTNVGPIKAVTAFSLDLGEDYRVTLTPDDNLYINKMEQYVEVVAVNPTITGMYPLAINLGLYNPVARISYTYGWEFPVTGDLLESESPTLFSGAYGNWDESVPPVVEVAGAEAAPSDYTVNYADGTIRFNSSAQPAPGELVTADYTYLAPSPIVDAIGYEVTDDLTRTRLNQRGLAGLSSLKVAEVSMTQMSPRVERGGVSLSAQAAALIGTYVFGSVQS